MDFDASSERLSERQLKWSIWWVNHKVLFYRIGIGIFAAIDLALVGYAGYGYFDWFLGTGVAERGRWVELSGRLTDFAAFRERSYARDLILEDTVRVSNNGTTDMFTTMSNPNAEWYATFTYSFAGSGGSTPERQSFILPGQTKRLFALGAPSNVSNDAVVDVKNLRWFRVNKRSVRPDYASWSAERLNLTVSDIAYEAPSPTDAVKVSRATFTVKNDTAFSYMRIGFFVAAYTGSSPSGITYVTISNLKAGETRTVDVNWVGDLGFVGQILVEPDLNIFDPTVYLAPGV